MLQYTAIPAKKKPHSCSQVGPCPVPTCRVFKVRRIESREFARKIKSVDAKTSRYILSVKLSISESLV
jgi:hypothetical protein